MCARNLPGKCLARSRLGWQREQQCQHIGVSSELAKSLCLGYAELISLRIERPGALRQFERERRVSRLQFEPGKSAQWPGRFRRQSPCSLKAHARASHISGLQQSLPEIERMLHIRCISGLRSLETCDRLGQHARLLRSDACSGLESCVGRPQLCCAQVRLGSGHAFGGLQCWLHGSE